jgi:hypothetical protein
MNGHQIDIDALIDAAITGSGSSISVETPTELTALDDGGPAGGMTNGSFAWVSTQRVPYYLDKTSIVALAPNSVVATGSGTGRWVRDLSFNDQTWLKQTTWHVDHTNGNDTNDGLTLATAIKTIAEWSRRTSGNYVLATSMFLYGAVWPTTDRFNYDLSCLADPAGGVIQFKVNGERTVVRSSTWTGFTNNPSQVTLNEWATITDTTVADWTPEVGMLIFVNGTSMWIAKDLGANTCRTSVPTAGQGGQTFVWPGNLAYTVNTLTKIHINARLTRGPGTFNIIDCELLNPVLGGSGSQLTVIYQRCKITAGFASRFQASYFVGCCFSTTTVWHGRCELGTACCLFLVPYNVTSPGFVMHRGTLFQGSPGVTAAMFTSGLGVANFAALVLGSEPGASIGITETLGVFDAAAGAIYFARGTVASCLGGSTGGPFIVGSNNATFAVRMRTKATLILSVNMPTITTTGTQVDLPSAGTPGMQIPELMPGAAVPAESACATWATLTAAPFNKRVTTVREGCYIVQE